MFSWSAWPACRTWTATRSIVGSPSSAAATSADVEFHDNVRVLDPRNASRKDPAPAKQRSTCLSFTWFTKTAKGVTLAHTWPKFEAPAFGFPTPCAHRLLTLSSFLFLSFPFLPSTSYHRPVILSFPQSAHASICNAPICPFFGSLIY